MPGSLCGWSGRSRDVPAVSRIPDAREKCPVNAQIELGDLVVDVQRKDIRNLRLSVRPPAGEVRISAPRGMSLDSIRAFVQSRIGWIRKHQQRIRAKPREAPRAYRDGESHFLWGVRYCLRVVEKRAVPSVCVRDAELVLQVRPGADVAKRAAVVNAWYREVLGKELQVLVRKWEDRIGVRASRIVIQRMKSRWGSCNTRTGSIRFSLALANKPPACVEYVVVHELVHLLEPSHNRRFRALMGQYLPQWKDIQDDLNRVPVGHEGLTCQGSFVSNR